MKVLARIGEIAVLIAGVMAVAGFLFWGTTLWKHSSAETTYRIFEKNLSDGQYQCIVAEETDRDGNKVFKDMQCFEQSSAVTVP